MDKDKIIPINELYACIQGEGKHTGIPHILIRFTGCKLRCQFAGSFCDTHYSSWKPEKGVFSLSTIEDFFKNHPQIKHTMITGGGPTSHPKVLPAVVDLAKKYDHYVTIETEGSEYVETNADCISLSPKLANSTPVVGDIKPWDEKPVTEGEQARHEKWRTNYTAMNLLINHQVNRGKEYQLKPVISTSDDIAEVKELQDFLDIPNNMVWMMPEGVTDQELAMKRKWLAEYCVDEGYNYTDRLHVTIYGDERGV